MADTSDWLQTAIDAYTTITQTRYNAQAAKEAAKVQSSIETSTAQTAAQQEKSTLLVRNVLLVLGGSLGLILLFGIAKKALK